MLMRFTKWIWSLSIRYFMKLQNDAKFFILEMITIKTPLRR